MSDRKSQWCLSAGPHSFRTLLLCLCLVTLPGCSGCQQKPAAPAQENTSENSPTAESDETGDSNEAGAKPETSGQEAGGAEAAGSSEDDSAAAADTGSDGSDTGSGNSGAGNSGAGDTGAGDSSQAGSPQGTPTATSPASSSTSSNVGSRTPPAGKDSPNTSGQPVAQSPAEALDLANTLRSRSAASAKQGRHAAAFELATQAWTVLRPFESTAECQAAMQQLTAELETLASQANSGVPLDDTDSKRLVEQ